MLKKLLTIVAVCIVSVLGLSSCDDKGYGYDDLFIQMLAGKWYINDESEYIEFYETDYIFEMNDWSVVGNFVINEKQPNEVLVIYDDEEGVAHSHKMRFHSFMGSNKSMYVDDAPMHEGERVLMYRPQ